MADNITEKRFAALVAQRDKIVTEIEALRSMVKTEQLKTITTAKDRDMWKARTELFMTVCMRLGAIVEISGYALADNDRELLTITDLLIKELRT